MYKQIIILHEVQKIDKQIDNVLKEIDQVKNDPQLQKMKKHKCSVSEVWESTYQELNQQKKQLKKAEIDLVEISQHLEEVESKIYDSKTTSKELEFLLKEKDNNLNIGNDLENKIIELLEEIDQKESLNKEQKSVLRDINKEISGIENGVKNRLSVLKKSFSELENIKLSKTNELTEKYLKEYKNKRKSLKGEIVSYVLDNQICGGCHIKISNNVNKKVIDKKVVKCEGCSRYLITM